MAVDINAILAEVNRLESKKTNRFMDNLVQMPEGDPSTLIIRLLPPADGERLPFFVSRTHKINDRNYHCPCNYINDSWVGNCPICNHYRKLWKESDSAGEEEAKALIAEARSIKPSERTYWNAIVRSMLNSDGKIVTNVGPKIWSTGVQLQKKILRLWGGDAKLGIKGLGDVTDPSTGRDLQVIRRVVKGAGTSYPGYLESYFLDHASPLGDDDEVAEWLANLHDLKALRKVESQEELKRQVDIHRGLIDDDQDSFPDVASAVDDEVPAPKARTQPSVFAQNVKPATSRTSDTQTVRQRAQQPVAPPVIEADEALADDDFLNRLKNM